jgi:hypothetical protein
MLRAPNTLAHVIPNQGKSVASRRSLELSTLATNNGAWKSEVRLKEVMSANSLTAVCHQRTQKGKSERC